MDFIAQPDDKFRLGDFLIRSFGDTDWTDFRAAVAFVKRSGTKHIREALAAFSKRARVRISVGIDSGGTSIEGLQDLIAAVGTTGQIWVFHNANNSTFHPKIYLFKNTSAADLVIGSGNLTEGGLYTNYEASVRLKLDLSRSEHRALLASAEAALDRWSTLQSGICLALDHNLGRLAKCQNFLGRHRILPEDFPGHEHIHRQRLGDVEARHTGNIL
ncbi:MAG: phospholipase D family protein [Candidatus Competibacteraceae bacterium]